jgi:hypothetical protein
MDKSILFFGRDYDRDSSEPINFLENRFTDLSPFSAHEVELDGVVYKTVEHAYQALRAIPSAREKIMQARSPMDAWREGQRCKDREELLEDYDKDVLMERILRAKLEQHEDIRAVLLESDNRELIKVIDSDSYWGTGRNGDGENRMGKIWMKLRVELQS